MDFIDGAIQLAFGNIFQRDQNSRIWGPNLCLWDGLYMDSNFLLYSAPFREYEFMITELTIQITAV